MRRRGPWRWGARMSALFWCARAIFAGGGVRLTTRGISWLGLGLTVLVAIQRATAPTLLFWTWRPLDSGASPYGPFVNRNSLACWLAMAVPLVIGYAVARHESRPPGTAPAAGVDSTQLWLGGAAVLMTGGLLGSLSRGGIFGGAIGLLVFVLLARTRRSPDARPRLDGGGTHRDGGVRHPLCQPGRARAAHAGNDRVRRMGTPRHLARHVGDGDRLPLDRRRRRRLSAGDAGVPAGVAAVLLQSRARRVSSAAGGGRHPRWPYRRRSRWRPRS